MIVLFCKKLLKFWETFDINVISCLLGVGSLYFVVANEIDTRPCSTIKYKLCSHAPALFTVGRNFSLKIYRIREEDL